MDQQRGSFWHDRAYANGGLRTVQATLLSRTLGIAFLLGLLGTIASVSRTVDSGLQPAPVAHVLTMMVLGWVLVTRRKRSYECMLAVLLGSLVFDGLAAFLSYGLIGWGFVFFLAAAIFGLVFAGRRIALGILLVGVLSALVFMLLFVSARLSLSMDLNTYNRHLSSWISAIMGLVFFAGILVAVIGGLFERLRAQIGEIRELNQSLEHKVASRTAQLRRSNQEKDRILGVVAHDLNNKLFGIVGNLELLKIQYDRLDDEKRRELLETALQTGIYAGDIVGELKEHSRPDDGSGSDIIRETVDLSAFIASTVEAYRPLAQEKDISLEMATPDTPIPSALNRAAFSRVIDNLVTNAIKFTPAGGKVTTSISSDVESVVVTVSDTGIGIPDELKAGVLAESQVASRRGTNDEPSTGLGMAIAKRIVERHGGTLWFESEEGTGSSFHVRLPR